MSCVNKTLLADLEGCSRTANGEPPLRCLLWQTKSAVQPRGRTDEWARLHSMPRKLREWAAEGPAESRLRPGKVDPFGGGPEDYRQMMTEVPSGASGLKCLGGRSFKGRSDTI